MSHECSGVHVSVIPCLQAAVFQPGSEILKQHKVGSQILKELQADFETARRELGILVINLLETQHGV